jgi:hypothetical protein
MIQIILKSCVIKKHFILNADMYWRLNPNVLQLPEGGDGGAFGKRQFITCTNAQ